MLNITLQFANPAKISGGSAESGGNGGEESLENITVLAPSIYSAVNIANHIISKKFVLSHTKLIVFSDEVAKSGAGVFMDAISRNGEIRPNIYFAVSKCMAREFLEAVDPETEVNPVRYYTMMFENDYSGFIPQNISLDFYLFYESDEKCTVMPLCSVAKNDFSPEFASGGYQYKVEDYTAGEITTDSPQIQIAGTAIFLGDAKIAEAGDIKTELFNMLTGEYQSSFVSYFFEGSPDVPVTVEQRQKKKPRVSVKTDGALPEIDITLFFEADIVSGCGDGIPTADVLRFSKSAGEEIKTQIIGFLEETKALGTDIVGFGSYAKRNFMTLDEFSEYRWKEKYKDAKITVNVDFSVKRSGVTVGG